MTGRKARPHIGWIGGPRNIAGARWKLANDPEINGLNQGVNLRPRFRPVDERWA